MLGHNRKSAYMLVGWFGSDRYCKERRFGISQVISIVEEGKPIIICPFLKTDATIVSELGVSQKDFTRST